MDQSLWTFSQLVSTLRKATNERDLRPWMKIFPNTKYGRSISSTSGGLDENLLEYNKDPKRLPELIRQGKIKINLPFFDRDISRLLKEVFEPCYPQDDIGKIDEPFRRFETELKKAKQYFGLSRKTQGEIEIANDRIARAVENFNISLPPGLEKWKASSMTIEEISELIDYAKINKNRFRSRPGNGRPPKLFNVLLFHVVNQFIQCCYAKNRELIEKDGRIKVRKNWQLICAALLWLHVNYDIPEMRTFIKEHENEDAAIALKKLKIKFKREYQAFKRSGKGTGKFQKPFEDGSEYLGFPFVYRTEKGLRWRYI